MLLIKVCLLCFVIGLEVVGFSQLHITRKDPAAEWYHFLLPVLLILAGLTLAGFTPTILSWISTPATCATCTNCGTELAGEFCHKCGAAVDTIVKCAKCGLDAIGEFCHGCGAAIK